MSYVDLCLRIVYRVLTGKDMAAKYLCIQRSLANYVSADYSVC